jgi:hypothetical protein
MNIEILNGTEKRLYLTVAPLAMNGQKKLCLMFIMLIQYMTGQRKIYGLQMLNLGGRTINYMTCIIWQDLILTRCE